MSRKSDLTVLVTGSTGYVGQALVEKLSRRNVTVVSMYRHKLPESTKQVFPVCSNLTNQELLAAPLRGVDVVVHLAWDHTSACIESGPYLERPAGNTPNLAATQCLLDAMGKLKTRRVIQLSCLGVSFGHSSRFLAEKYAAEQIVINSTTPEKVIIRTAPLFGGGVPARERFLAVLSRATQFPGFYPKSPTEKDLQPLAISNLTDLLVEHIFAKHSNPVSLVHALGSESVSFDKLFKWLLESQGKHSRIAVGGVLGRWLESWLEREQSAGGPMRKIEDFRAFVLPDLYQKVDAQIFRGTQSIKDYIFELCKASQVEEAQPQMVTSAKK